MLKGSQIKQMIGLRTTSQVVIQTDIVRREELMTLMSCDQVEQKMRERVRERLDQAAEQAEQIVEQANAEAANIRQAARERFERSGRLGYAAGQRAAVRAWNDQCLQQSSDEQQRWQAEREHWIGVVVDACAALLHDQDPSALYQRAAQALDHVGAMRAQTLTVHVAYGQGAQARAAFDAMTSGQQAPTIDVREMEDIQVGHCRCEWAGGCLETGLQLELDMLREALGRATPQSPPPSPANAALPPGSMRQDAPVDALKDSSWSTIDVSGDDDALQGRLSSAMLESGPATMDGQANQSLQTTPDHPAWGALA